MDAKKLLKKHLDLNIPKGVFMSGKQLEQANYDASIGAINEALGIVPEPVLQENLGRESMIEQIKRIMNKVGSFSMGYGAIESENTIIVSQIGNTTTEIFSFNEENVDCDIYVDDIETGGYNYLYSELSDEVLAEVLYLVELVEVDQDKTYKRIS